MADALILRRAQAEDAAAIAALYAPYVRDTVITFETEAPGSETMADRIVRTLTAQLPYIVAIDGNGATIGYAYAGSFHPRRAYRFTVEPTVYIAQDARGSGTGTRLYDRLLLILTQLGYRQAVALVTLPNPASVALHERFGFRHSGTHTQVGYKFDQWIDVGLFQAALGGGAETLPVDEPLPLDRSAAWAELG